MAGALAGMLCLLAPAVAGASVRVAAPNGGGTACTEATPCDIQTAVEAPAVVDGDEVVLLPGTYSTGTNSLVASDGIYLHGAAGAARPLIDSNSGPAVLMGDAGGTIENVDVRTSAVGVALRVDKGWRAQRVISIASANGAIGCRLVADPVSPPLIEESACIANGSGGTAVLSNLGVTAGIHLVSMLRNVTAVATGPSSAGVKSISSGSGGSLTVQGVNVIASGTAADISADGGSGGSFAFAQFTFSNFDTQLELTNAAVTDPGYDSNVTGAAMLANPAAGDVHQRPGSWTIDRGSKASEGVDLDGEPRFQGAAPDIGADEFVVLAKRQKCFGESATIVAASPGTVAGTPGRDVIIGTRGPDTIISGGGKDLVCSLGGSDRIRAGGGSDKAKGEGGRDKILGNGGNDRLLGGGGRDRLTGGTGKDLLVGQGGLDRLLGGKGRDQCGSAVGRDRISRCE